MSLFRHLLRFGLVGVLGFAVDGGILWVLVSGDMSALLARAVSFPAAVVTTWWLNRTWTFASTDRSRPHRQFNLYFFVQLLGALANFVVYALVLGLMEPSALNALWALAAGSFVGMFINFTGSRFFIFKTMAGADADR